MRNTGNTFDSLMDRILFSLHFTFPFLDDIFICSRSEEEHQSHVTAILQCLQDASLCHHCRKNWYETSSPWTQLPPTPTCSLKG